MIANNATIITPLAVPWMVSPSAPELEVKIGPYETNLDAVVSFVAFFGEGTRVAQKWGNYRKVKTTFVDCSYAKYYPECSLEEGNSLDTYDWSLIPEFRNADGSLRSHTERFREVWTETDVCPNPRCYEIANSTLIDTLHLNSQEFKHYLLFGEDFYIELVAKNMTWKPAE